MISSKEDYLKELKFYVMRSKGFEDYMRDKRMPKKEYIDLKFAAYFQCFNKRRATAEALRSFRKFYPDIPVHLLSDDGEDFSAIAKKFTCDYTYDRKNVGAGPVPCKDIKAWFKRLYDTCMMYENAEWILILEDDVRTRDRISKYPNAHLAGQAGGNYNISFSQAAKEYIWKFYPELEINGFSGCGGSIFHRKSFLMCYENIDRFDVEKLKKLDDRLCWATDICLDYFFNLNGFISRRWLDLSAENFAYGSEYGPASAFDHQYKKYYKKSFMENVYYLARRVCRGVFRRLKALIGKMTIKNLAIMLFRKPPAMTYGITTPNGLMISSKESYLKELKFYMMRSKGFEDYMCDKRMPPKEYIDLKFAVYFQCYNEKIATAEALRSFREFYPDIKVRLLSDDGEDFSAIAKKFNCDYIHAPENLGYWPCKDMKAWFKRLYETCLMHKDAEWILLLEDDVRTRDRISKYPNAHLAGQAGGVSNPPFSQAAKEYVWKLYPGLEINGYSGAGGSIFHRKSFLICYENIDRFDIEKLKKLDDRLEWATDIALDYLFHLNGFVSRRWLDFSEALTHCLHGPASAFEHLYKKYYKKDPEHKYFD